MKGEALSWCGKAAEGVRVLKMTRIRLAGMVGWDRRLLPVLARTQGYRTDLRLAAKMVQMRLGVVMVEEVPLRAAIALSRKDLALALFELEEHGSDMMVLLQFHCHGTQGHHSRLGRTHSRSIGHSRHIHNSRRDHSRPVYWSRYR
jgi:hypothetical protein